LREQGILSAVRFSSTTYASFLRTTCKKLKKRDMETRIKKIYDDNLKNALIKKQKKFASVYYTCDIHEKSFVKMINDIPLTGEIKPNVMLKESTKF
jgi:hypothetical protein